MESDDDVPLILTWDEANSGLLSEEAERGDESKFLMHATVPSHDMTLFLVLLLLPVAFLSGAQSLKSMQCGVKVNVC